MHSAWGGRGEGLCGFAQPTLSAQEEASVKMPRTENQRRKGKCLPPGPEGEEQEGSSSDSIQVGLCGLESEAFQQSLILQAAEEIHAPFPPTPRFSNPPEPQRGMELLKVYYGNYLYNIPAVEIIYTTYRRSFI